MRVVKTEIIQNGTYVEKMAVRAYCGVADRIMAYFDTEEECLAFIRGYEHAMNIITKTVEQYE